MKKLAFVTGATGLLGSNLVPALLQDGYDVRALVRSPEKARAQLDVKSIEIVPGDLTRIDAFAGALRGVEIVFHTAAFFRESFRGGSHSETLHSVNVDGTRALLQACYEAGVRRFVHTSSVAVLLGSVPGATIDETMPCSPDGERDQYSRSKVLADRVVDEFLRHHPDFWATFVLPGFMNGPGDAGPTAAGQFLLDFMNRRLPGIIDASLSYVDVRDVAQAHIAAADRGHRGERYAVAGRTTAVADVVALLENITGVAGPTRRVPMSALAVVALVNEAWARVSGRPVLLSWAGYRTLKRQHGFANFDSSKAIRELGVEFRPLRETLADGLRWFEERGMLPPGSASGAIDE